MGHDAQFYFDLSVIAGILRNMLTIESVFAVLLSISACSLCLLGLGLLFQSFLGKQGQPFEMALVGLGISVAILEVYHLFRPIDWIIALVLALASLIGLAIRLPYLHRFLRHHASNQKEVIIALSTFAFLVGIRSIGPCEHFDTGLYGAQAVRWLTTYRAVPGLANFYARLGFNNSFFLLVACLQAGGFGSMAYRVWEGLLLLLISAAALRSMKTVLRADENRVSDWFSVTLSIPTFFYICRGDLIGTNTDLPADFMCFLGTYLFLRDLETDPGSSSGQYMTLFAACVSFALAIVFKLSTAVFAGPCCLLCLVKLFHRQRIGDSSRKTVPTCFALVGAMLLGWMCAGYVQSGYPFFPEAAFGLPLDWRFPENSARLLAAIIKSFARMRNVSRSKTAGWAWIHPWLAEARHDRVEFVIPMLIICFGILVLGSSWRASRRHMGSLWLLLLPCIAGIVFWFISAPALRFVQGEVWVLTGSIAAVALSNKRKPFKNALLTLVILALAVVAAGPTTLLYQFYDPLFAAHAYALFPETPTTTKETGSGLKVIVPATGQQCWDAPLPCTPYFNPNVELRQAQSLRSGFRPSEISEAQWLPVD